MTLQADKNVCAEKALKHKQVCSMQEKVCRGSQSAAGPENCLNRWLADLGPVCSLLIEYLGLEMDAECGVHVPNAAISARTRNSVCMLVLSGHETRVTCNCWKGGLAVGPGGGCTAERRFSDSAPVLQLQSREVSDRISLDRTEYPSCHAFAPVQTYCDE